VACSGRRPGSLSGGSVVRSGMAARYLAPLGAGATRVRALTAAVAG
jgi:hypothetical protein